MKATDTGDTGQRYLEGNYGPVREERTDTELPVTGSIPEHLDGRYAANPTNRCYFCKSELHDRLREIADAEGWQAVVDGNNASDSPDSGSHNSSHGSAVASPTSLATSTRVSGSRSCNRAHSR